ncbi:MAG TPA: histidine phosphatase family protein [Anaerolineales bacterium]|nr:histidine phosphatase family protein [Anaerolineales bacterium]
MTILFLIRHGENDWVGRRLPGWTHGLHLNARGLAQAEALAGLLAPAKLEAIYASPLERTMETAAPIARAAGLRVRTREALADVNPGEWQGKSLRSLRHRSLWTVIQHAPSLARFPGGESFAGAQARIIAELEAIRAEHRAPRAAVACVTHADAIRLAIAHYIGLHLDLFQRLTVDPASISVLWIGDGSARLVRLNDTRASAKS